ncbi:MAG: NAD(P)H-hydrate epimerase [Ruminococcus sp.]|nr:NAD(P)H-hydrate epimerase [Ruminococcus sp.]
MNIEHVVSVENMRQSDAKTIENGITSAELMHRAAMGIFNAAKFTGKVAVVCGSGNNGGDGYALACILCENGFTPTIFRTSGRFSKDGLFYYKTALSMGAVEESLNAPNPFTGYDIVVDCILGTGFSGEVSEDIKRVIDEINACQSFIISADINSGINGDTGVAPVAVNSDLTVSIGYLKTGMFLNDAPYYIDKLRNVDIGISLLHEEYKLADYEMLHMFEGYNSVSMTIEEFYDRFGFTPQDGGIAEKAAQLSAEQGKTIVIKTAHSAVIADIKYVYFCADYII